MRRKPKIGRKRIAVVTMNVAIDAPSTVAHDHQAAKMREAINAWIIARRGFTIRSLRPHAVQVDEDAIAAGLLALRIASGRAVRRQLACT
jgi:hypothetical protein